MMRVVSEIMHRDDLPPASRLKAVELAMKAIAVYDEKVNAENDKGADVAVFTPEEEENLRKAGQGALLDIAKKNK
jgi:hypothetical protein